MIQARETGAEPTGFIFDIKRYAIHDGPGIRTTVFFKGCPLRCRWCQNPESWDVEPEHGLRVGRCRVCGRCLEACTRQAITLSADRPVTDPTRCTVCGECVKACVTEAREIIGRRAGVKEIVAEIEKDVIFYDQSGGGVTFSGGEPLMQADFLHEMLLQCKAREIHTALDTTCYAQPELMERISNNVDLFLCDLKHMDSEMHERYTGVGNELILGNIRRLASAGRNIALRVPVVPDFNDDMENIGAIGRFAASLGGISTIDILPYNSGGREKAVRLMGEHDLLDARPLDDERLAVVAGKLREFGFTVRIGG